MEQNEKTPEEQQRELRRARARKLDRMFNRIIICLGLGVVALMVYKYVLVPMMN